jgi:imidazole glycerol-phosphate synthase subunit HisH
VNPKQIGIIDYGVGNHASVSRAFKALGYRCRVTSDSEVLAQSDVIVLPGVGAFPAAMAALHAHGLVDFLRQSSQSGKAIIGFCLGMQLLADESSEHGVTNGLGLIPGVVVSLGSANYHIGWNAIEVVNEDKLLQPSDGELFYFNHSYIFNAPREYHICVSRLEHSFVVGVRRRNVVGLQFHPEKSQMAGRKMLKNLVEGLTCA